MESPKGRQLKSELQAFKRAFESSPTGVWVDENKTKLIVIGALGVIGGTYYMYKNRTGDSIADLEKGLLKKTWEVGTVNLETKVTKLKPSVREFEFSSTLNYKWRKINTKMVVTAFGHEDFADVSTLGKLTFPLATNISASFGADYNTKNIPLAGDTPADSTSEFNAYLEMQYIKDKISIQLNATTGSTGEYSIGVILHLEF